MLFFGFLTLGAFIGWLSYTFSGSRGIRMVPSMIAGAVSALFGGAVVVLFDLKGSMIYAVIASVTSLFTINAFRKKKPIFEEPEN
ncbi:MAG: hypothetical protein JXR20_09290 [Balneola sp.]